MWRHYYSIYINAILVKLDTNELIYFMSLSYHVKIKRKFSQIFWIPPNIREISPMIFSFYISENLPSKNELSQNYRKKFQYIMVHKLKSDKRQHYIVHFFVFVLYIFFLNLNWLAQELRHKIKCVDINHRVSAASCESETKAKQ